MGQAAELPRQSDAPIRVMLVDDSPIVRGMNARILKEIPNIKIVATAENGQMAVDRMDAGDIDVVVLDIEMPVMDGLTAIPLLLAKNKNVKILMSSTLTLRGAEVSFRAMQLGATDFIAKPSSTGGEASYSVDEYRREVVEKVKNLGRAAIDARTPETSGARTAAAKPAARKLSAVPKARFAPKVLAFGSSTGGPTALLKIFRELETAPCPVLVTQHMPPHFTATLARHIDGISPMPCSEAKDGDVLRNGQIYVAPGDYHMTVAADGSSRRISLNQEAPENFCRPAVDPMFRSLGNVFGNGAMCIVLTGMGRDGAAGAEAVSAAGGYVIAQDEETSVVWGMPGATFHAGAVDSLLPLEEIAPFINKATGDKT